MTDVGAFREEHKVCPAVIRRSVDSFVWKWKSFCYEWSERCEEAEYLLQELDKALPDAEMDVSYFGCTLMNKARQQLHER
jgi:hypothetical protein